MEIIIHENKNVFFNPAINERPFFVTGETLKGHRLGGVYFAQITPGTDAIHLINLHETVEILLDDFLFQQDKLHMRLMH